VRHLEELRIFSDKLFKYKKLIDQNIHSIGSKNIDTIEDLRVDLQRSYARLEEIIAKYGGTRKVEVNMYGAKKNVFEFGLEPYNSLGVFDQMGSINESIKLVNNAIGKVEAEGETWIDSMNPEKNKSDKIKAFISHGKVSPALSKIEKYLRELDIEPLIVVEKASLGKTIPEKVEYYMDRANFVIILATSDNLIDGKMNPRGNVLHEIGLAQIKFPGKIIYLLEKGCEFSSNISPRVWERFSQDNLENVYSRLVIELKALGFI
jgi:predicted nucleotide-binding protein